MPWHGNNAPARYDAAEYMNVSTPKTDLKPPVMRDVISEPRLSRLGQLGDVLLGKGVTLALTTLALMVGLATFIILARGSPLGWKPGVSVGLVLANLSVLLLLGAVAGGPADARLGGAAARIGRLARCMCGWSSCSAASPSRRPSSWPASPSPFFISASSLVQ